MQKDKKTVRDKPIDLLLKTDIRLKPWIIMKFLRVKHT